MNGPPGDPGGKVCNCNYCSVTEISFFVDCVLNVLCIL